MEPRNLIDLFLEMATLKRVPRTGWQTRGVPHVESVAEHSFGVVFVSLALADLLQSSGHLEGELDVEKVLIIAVLHDLAEIRLGDLPSGATRLVPDAVKSEAEATAMAGLLAPLPASGRLRSLWKEFEDETSLEGKLVRDADKLEMMVQCLRYEQAGSRGLDEFWAGMDSRRWHLPLCEELYSELRARRPSL